MSAGEEGHLEWDKSKLAEAMKLLDSEVCEYFTDGRRVSFLLERRIAREVLHGKISGNENTGYDITDSIGNKWEVRSITKRVYFPPSKNVGSGREFNKDDFLGKLREIKGYYLVDVMQFPKMPYWSLNSEEVRGWWTLGKLGKNASCSRKRIFELIVGRRQTSLA